jgi:hypothetical protein
VNGDLNSNEVVKELLRIGVANYLNDMDPDSIRAHIGLPFQVIVMI